MDFFKLFLFEMKNLETLAVYTTIRRTQREVYEITELLKFDVVIVLFGVFYFNK